MELFDGLYGVMSAGQRSRMLFGDMRTGAREFFERSLISDAFPYLYFEFPLLGEPGLDLLAIYDRIRPGSRFGPTGGYGYQAAFDWFASLEAEEAREAAIGLELDLSRNKTDQAGVYFQQRQSLDQVRPFLRAVGEEGRADAYLHTAERMPRGWGVAYVGLFPGRDGAPTRLGGYLSEPSRRRCAQDVGFLASRFDLIGFDAYDTQMLKRCSRLMDLVPGVDFQFDLTPQGKLASTFGLSLSFGRRAPTNIAARFMSSYGAEVMGAFERWGLADERWRHIPGAVFARAVDFDKKDGRTGRLVASVRLNYAKLKFVNAVAQPAKFYLVATVRELP